MLRLAYSAGPGFCSANWGRMAGKAVGTFAPPVARYGLKNVPTHIEIIAELPVPVGYSNPDVPMVKPPKIGKASTRPTLWASRGIGASFLSDRCVRLSLYN
jgi:hypothetical protein